MSTTRFKSSVLAEARLRQQNEGRRAQAAK
jgi:hypothetical protein